MTARTPPGRSTRSQAANSSPASWSSSPGAAQQPAPQQPATASAACPVTGLPGASRGPGRRAAAGRPGTGRAAGTRCGRRGRGRGRAAGGCRGLGDRREQPPAAATRSPGTENVSMTRRAAAAVTGPPHGGRPGRRRARAGRARCSAARRGPSAGRAAPGPPWRPGQGRPVAVPGWVEGLCHGGWSRVPPLSALTLHKSGFRGLFSPARRRNIPAAANYQGESRQKIFPGFSGAAAALYHMPCTWRVPGMYLRYTSPQRRRSAR